LSAVLSKVKGGWPCQLEAGDACCVTSRPMAKSEFRVRMDGPISIVEVHGVLNQAAAADLLEFAAAAAGACRAVQIELAHVESMTPEAAELLLFPRAPGHALPDGASLQANGKPGRQAVLCAYSRRRSRSQTA